MQVPMARFLDIKKSKMWTCIRVWQNAGSEMGVKNGEGARGMRGDRNFNGAMRDKNTSVAGSGFIDFDRREAGW